LRSSRGTPQLLWQDDFSRNFRAFFSAVRLLSASNFCALSLVKLCGNFTWGPSTAQLGLAVGEAIGMAYRCIDILEENEGKKAFRKSLRELAMRLSNNADKVDYCAR
jgi:hypothetical protein